LHAPGPVTLGSRRMARRGRCGSVLEGVGVGVGIRFGGGLLAELHDNAPSGSLADVIEPASGFVRSTAKFFEEGSARGFFLICVPRRTLIPRAAPVILNLDWF